MHYNSNTDGINAQAQSTTETGAQSCLLQHLHGLLTYRDRVSLKETQQLSFAGVPIFVNIVGT